MRMPDFAPQLLSQALSRGLSGQFLRFLVVGAINTALGCALYILFALALSHTLAYLLTFIIVTSLTGLLHAHLTFLVPPKRRSWALTLLAYFLIYLVNATVLEIIVRGYGVDKFLAILGVAATSVPVTFLVMRQIFIGPANHGHRDL
jgi:putative flippase GtrA